MRRETDKFPGSRPRLWPVLFLLLPFTLLAGALSPVRADIDYSVNQTVWKMLYGVTDAQINDPAWLARDDDGDGLSNGAELAAGTNPFSAASTLAITTMTPGSGGTGPVFTFPTVAGKQYVLQSNPDVTNPAGWSPVANIAALNGTGLPGTLTAPAPDPAAGSMFYRVAAQDVDTDGDGLSDWAEKVTGFDPTTAYTHGAATDDHTALTNDLVQENVVTVATTKATATQPADAMTAASDTATITITRGGTLHFSTITVPLNWSGTAVTGVDYAALPASVTFPPKVGVITLTVVPMANPSRQTGATVTLAVLPGGGYTVGAAQSASAVINPAGNANGTGLTGTYFNSTSSKVFTYDPSLFTGTPALTRIDAGLDFNWNSGSPGTGVNATYFTARWQGQVQPQYSETYTFDVLADDGVKLWVNGQLLINTWTYVSTDRLASIALQAGVKYDIQIDYFQGTGGDQMHLYWYSNSQPKQAIPSTRLYPVASTPAPPAITSAPMALGFVGQPFSFAVTTSYTGGAFGGVALGAGSGPLPPGLTLNSRTGVISGTPTTAGDYQAALTATNAFGVGASVLDIQILNPGSGVTRELWNNLPDANLSSLPLAATPDGIDTNLTTLEDNIGTYGTNTGERLRGYFTAPVTGNYYFWLAASNNAELWIADDTEPVNLVRRAWVTAPGTGTESWSDANQTHQRTPWLSLVAGQSYYYEVLHNTGGAPASNNVAVACLQDPTGAAANPGASAVVPGYVLGKYNYPTATAAAGTLFITNLSPQGTSVSSATGSANLRMLPGNSQAILHFNYGGLSSPRTAYHLHIAPDQTGSGPIVFDLDDVDKFHPELKTDDGGYIWNIVASGAYSAAQIVSAIQGGTIYFNVHTVNFPNGEIRGFLTQVNGSQTPPAYVADPGFPDDSASDAGAARFLNQAAYGAAPADMTAVQGSGYASWIGNQMSLPVTHILADVQAQVAAQTNTNLSATPVDNAWWRASINAPDQLRQRVAFALSEILVVSDTNATISNTPTGLASYYDLLADRAFGNFRDLLEAATLHPAMGYWLNMQGNQKGNLATGYHPNENYAREVMQLFSIGLNRLWPDGRLVLDSTGSLVPTYNQNTITGGFARVFTGWTWHQASQASGQLPTNFYPPVDWLDPMVMVKNYHELGAKTLLDNVVLPPAVGYNPPAAITGGSQADTTTTAYDAYCQADLEAGLDNIFYHPNVGPYVCRQLIQRLVESNPSPAYLYRVVSKFNDDGTSAHVRGNMTAVINAILLDGEARNTGTELASTTAGKQREPLLRITGPGRTFLASANSGTYSQSGSAATMITTANPHNFSAGDGVWLDFSPNDTGTPPVAPANNPTTGVYSVLSSPAPTATTFAVNALGESTVSCSEAAGTTVLTVNTAGPAVGEKVYLKFLTGGFTDGVYPVATLPTTSSFTVNVATAAGSTAVAGTVLMPKMTAYDNLTKGTADTSGNVTAASKISIVANTNPNLNVGDHVWIVAGSSNQLKDAEWVVASVIDERHFTVTCTAAYSSESNIGVTLYPLVAPPLTRSGSVNLPSGEYNMGNTNAAIVQTPLDSPTVFNFFYPDYEYPGSLASNSVTVPEFQLTTDSNIITLTNTVASTVLSSNNVRGLSSFKNGALNLDLSAYMGAPYCTVNTVSTTKGTAVTAVTTTTVDANALVNKLGDLLTGGAMSMDAKNQIIAFVNNATYFPATQTATGTTSSPPTAPSLPTTSARDRVRAVVHAILVSPEYAIQR